MVKKDTTIKKAMTKYHAIFPIRGKNSIEECFFCMRGEYFFLFRTEDKKRHILKAEMSRPSFPSADTNQDFIISAFQFLNKPIYVRSLFIKK